jgi:hypothetical protein
LAERIGARLVHVLSKASGEHMRLILIAAAVALVSTSAFAADSSTPAQSGPQNPAVHTDNANNSNMPVAGANSFTQGEAMDRIKAKGFTHISTLTKDDQGIWRGTARMHGHTGPVSVDYQGNVN